MTRRLVWLLVLVGLLAGFAVSAAGRWIQVYSDSDYLHGTDDYWDYRMTLVTGASYRFILTGIPWYADFDMRIWRDFDHDSRYDYPGERITGSNSGYAGEDESFDFTPQASASSQSSTPYKLRVYSFSGSGWYTLYVYKWA